MLFESGSTPARRTVVNPERQRNEETKKKVPKAAFDSVLITRPSAAERETENASWAAETRKDRDLLGENEKRPACFACRPLVHFWV
jgi:hypothetical protein